MYVHLEASSHQSGPLWYMHYLGLQSRYVVTKPLERAGSHVCTLGP
jgi:hypothetical protein